MDPLDVDPTHEGARKAMGHTLTYARKMNLAKMTPKNGLASTGYCLANPSATGAEYLVYLPSGGSVTMNLSSSTGSLKVEWFNPGTGSTVTAGSVTGGSSKSFTAPFSGDAVLYLSAA